MATIYDVAQQAGVSTATVSRSFSNASPLSAETRQRVLDVAERLNYRPRRAQVAQSAVGKDRRIVLDDPIGFQFFSFSERDTVQKDSFYAPLLRGAQAEATASGHHLLLHTMYRHDHPHTLPKSICDRQIAGMLLVGAADPEILTTFFAHVPKLVLVDNRDLCGRHDSVLSDGFSGVFAATNYLFDLGHRQIGFAMSEPQTLTFRDRLHGYLSAHFDHQMPIDPQHIVMADTMDDFMSHIRSLLASPQRPTAILAANDAHAYLVMQAARDLDLNIPNDLSLIGFDDDQYSALAYPPLTTLSVDKEYMGRLAVRRLLIRLKEEGNQAPEPPIQIEVPVTLVHRASCRHSPV